MLNISGIDRAELIAGLYNGTPALGMGILHDRGTLTPEDIREDLGDRIDGDLHFDYYHGHPLKVSIQGEELHGEALYDRDAGEGMATRIIETLRR
jgi:hypothetical protein